MTKEEETKLGIVIQDVEELQETCTAMTSLAWKLSAGFIVFIAIPTVISVVGAFIMWQSDSTKNAERDRRQVEIKADVRDLTSNLNQFIVNASTLPVRVTYLEQNVSELEKAFRERHLNFRDEPTINQVLGVYESNRLVHWAVKQNLEAEACIARKEAEEEETEELIYGEGGDSN